MGTSSRKDSRSLNTRRRRLFSAGVACALAIGAFVASLDGAAWNERACPPIVIHYESAHDGAIVIRVCATLPIGSMIAVRYELTLRATLIAPIVSAVDPLLVLCSNLAKGRSIHR